MVEKSFCAIVDGPAAGTVFCGSLAGKTFLGDHLYPRTLLLAVWIPRRTSACDAHRGASLATRPGAVTPVASVLQAPAGTASVALLAWPGAVAPHATPAPDPLHPRPACLLDPHCRFSGPVSLDDLDLWQEHCGVSIGCCVVLD